MKGASKEVQASLNQELSEAQQRAVRGDDGDGDEALIVGDYASDEEGRAGSEDEEEQPEEAVHCTKVSPECKLYGEGMTRM